jgi:hypothetical protein
MLFVFSMAPKKKRAKKKPFGDGFAYEFHGSYKLKSAAKAKAANLNKHKGVDAWTISRKVFHGPSGLRHVVLSKRAGNVPF